MEFKHYSVLFNECIDNLIKSKGIYVDATVGGGGHSKGILETGICDKLICFDQDIDAINASKNRLKDYSDKTIFIHSNFENIKNELENLGISKVDGIIADLGVSSYQIDNYDRGFSYMHDANLDMRMDTTNPYTAYNIVNEYTELELLKIFREYGEEKFANNIAKNIVKNRPINTTLELVDIIRKSIPKKYLVNLNSHPAKRIFQAIRIELNREIEILEKSLGDMIELLRPNGRLCVITFHSLEDRIVKHIFKNAENPCICPPEFPKCVCNRKSLGRVITKKPILPSAYELKNNSRSASAKLRVFERNDNE